LFNNGLRYSGWRKIGYWSIGNWPAGITLLDNWTFWRRLSWGRTFGRKKERFTDLTCRTTSHNVMFTCWYSWFASELFSWTSSLGRGVRGFTSTWRFGSFVNDLARRLWFCDRRHCCFFSHDLFRRRFFSWRGLFWLYLANHTLSMSLTADAVGLGIFDR
jgi:hypothetical protein